MDRASGVQYEQNQTNFIVFPAAFGLLVPQCIAPRPGTVADEKA
jgi:hypothetical protein